MFKLFGGGSKSDAVGAAVLSAADVASSATLGDASSRSRPSLAVALSERLDADCQMRGHLYKRDTSGSSSSWKLRFFVLKDGFLLYYQPLPSASSASASSASSASALDDASALAFDLHPKGVVPLDGVEIETVRLTAAGPKAVGGSSGSAGLTSAFRLTHPSFGTRSLLLCAADDSERDKWVAALSAGSYVTYGRAIAAAAELESSKRAMRELTLKASQLEALLAKKNEQVIRLVAQNKQLLGLGSPNHSAAPSAASSSSSAVALPSPDELPPPPPGVPLSLPPPPPPAPAS